MTGASPNFDLDSILAEEDFVRGLARSLLFDEHEVDDLVQQTWLLALKHRVVRPKDGSPRTWLATVVRNVARNQHRSATRRAHHEREAGVAEALPSTDELLAQHDVKRKVVEVVGALPEPYRATILLRYFEQLPPRLIAAQTGVPKATVAVRLKRGLQMLRERLDVEHSGERRAWCLALVPVAASRPMTAGALSSKVVNWLGVLMMMKSTILTISVLACLLLIGLSYYMTQDLARPEVLAKDLQGQSKAVALKSDENTRVRSESALEVSRESVDADLRPSPEASIKAALAGFRGRLLKPDGQPAAGATVRIMTVDPLTMFGADAAPMSQVEQNSGPRAKDTVCDEDGVFVIDGLWPRGIHALHAGVGAEFSLLKMIEQSPGPGQIVDLGTIKGLQKAVIEGLVVGDEGEPLVGAEVWAADLPGAVLAVAPIDRLAPDGGVFLSLPKLGPRELPEADAEGFHRRLRRHLATTVVQAERGGSYVVLDLPVWAQNFLRFLPRANTVTDAEGRFRLVGVEPGNNVLVVRAAGYANGGKVRVPVRVDRLRRVGKIRMRRGRAIDGMVRDAAGDPVSGAELRAAFRPAVGLTGILFADKTVRTDRQGRFEVPNLPRGEAVLALRRDANSPWHVMGQFATDEEELELLLPDQVAGILEVQTVAGEAISGVRFEVQDGPPLGEFAGAGFVRRRMVEAQPEAGRAGRYNLGSLEPGVYSVFAHAPGFAMNSTVIRVGPETAVHSLRLKPAARLEVEVADSEGQAVAGARVYAMHSETKSWSRTYLHRYGGIDGWDKLPLLLGVTDRDGLLSSSRLAAGEVRLLIRHPAFGVADARCDLPGEIRVELETPGVIYGQLFDRGVPASGSRYRLTAVRSREDRSVAPEIKTQASIGESGKFRIEGLTPGKYMVRCVASIGDVRSLGSMVKGIKPSFFFFNKRRQESIVVVAGAEHELIFDVDPNLDPKVAGFQFSGRVRVSGKAAVGCAWYTEDDGDRPLAVVDANGAFLAQKLKKKRLKVSLVDPKQVYRTLWRGQIDLTRGTDVLLNLDLTYAPVTGQVLGYDKSPAAKYNFFLDGGDLPLGGEGRYRGVTDKAGRLSVSVPPGTYRLSVSGLKGDLQVKAFSVPVSGVSEQVWQLQREGLLAGRVDMSGATIREAAWVQVESLIDGRPSSTFRGTSKGHAFFFLNRKPGEYKLTVMDEEFNRYEAIPRTVLVGETGLVDLVLRVGKRIK